MEGHLVMTVSAEHVLGLADGEPWTGGLTAAVQTGHGDWGELKVDLYRRTAVRRRENKQQ